MQIRCTQADHQNQQIIGFCIDNTCQNQRPYCNFCLPCHVQHLNKLTTQELVFEWIQERILEVGNVQKNFQECKIALDRLTNVFHLYNNYNIQQFTELGLTQIDQIIKVFCLIEACEEKLLKQLKQSIEQIKLIANELLKKIKNQTNTNFNDNLQIPFINIDKQILEQPKQRCKVKPNINSFSFDLMNQNPIKQNQSCYAIAFNRDNQIVVAACVKNIKIFQHTQGKLNQIQLLKEHTNYLTTLNFMKNTNSFVSGSFDNSIIIWQVIGNNQWKFYQKLHGHSNHIFCLLLNNTDDLIISSSADKTIRFWIKQNQWLCQQIITEHNDYVYQISLNEHQIN